MELPAGAIRVAPLEESVEGVIVFPTSEWNQERVPWISYYGYGAGVVRLSLGDNSELGGSVVGKQAGALTDRRTPGPGAHGGLRACLLEGVCPAFLQIRAWVLALLAPLEYSGAPAGGRTPADA